MKTKIALLVCSSLIQLGFSQGFENLDFESAIVVPAYPPSTVYISSASAFPGWAVYRGPSNNPTFANPPTVGYDTEALDGGGIFLEDLNAPSGNGFGGFSLLPIQGNYSVLLKGSIPFADTSASIGQTGTIPITAQSLIFLGRQNNGNLQVTFSGQNIPYIAIGNGVNYTIYGANIASYAGQTGQLLFTTPIQTSALLDNIQFSSSSVPEPSGFALGTLGALLLGFRRWRNA